MSEKRDCIVPVRMTAAEREKLRRAAASAGRTVSQEIRFRVFGAPKPGRQSK
jgi:hypothetical protein